MHSFPIQSARTCNSVKISQINLLFFSFGALINAASYLSLAPVFAALIFFVFSQILLLLTPIGGVAERRIFNRVFAVGFLMAGIAAFYANQLHDALQLFSDAAGFFEMASTYSQSGLSLLELQVLHEGALAIVLWSEVYDFFSALGFPRERYIGISVNVTVVAFTGVVALKISRLVFGNDSLRFKILTSLFSCCGLFWLFAGIHMRDSIVLLSITLLTYGWLHFLSKPDLGFRLLQILALSLLCGLLIGFLRAEFVFVPIAMAFAATAALMFGRKNRRGRLIPYVLVLIGLVISMGLLAIYGDAIGLALLGGGEKYSKLATEQASADSLGMALIVNQVMPIRLLLGSVYLFVFPIPFWIGFQLESVYALFKSLNVIFFYFVLPLLILSLIKIWRNKEERTPAIMFLLFLSLGFTLAIAGTSLETRHFGAFLVPIFLLVLVPDFRLAKIRNNYKQLMQVVLIGVGLVHLTWVIIKL